MQDASFFRIQFIHASSPSFFDDPQGRIISLADCGMKHTSLCNTLFTRLLIRDDNRGPISGPQQADLSMLCSMQCLCDAICFLFITNKNPLAGGACCGFSEMNANATTQRRNTIVTVVSFQVLARATRELRYSKQRLVTHPQSRLILGTHVSFEHCSCLGGAGYYLFQ